MLVAPALALCAAPRPLLPRPSLHPARAGSLLQGPAGSSVTLTVLPAAGGAPRELVLQREPIKLNPVEAALCSSGGGRAGVQGGRLEGAQPRRLDASRHLAAQRGVYACYHALLGGATVRGCARGRTLPLRLLRADADPPTPTHAGRASALGGKLGYIRIASFAKPTTQGVREAIGSLQARRASLLLCLRMPRGRMLGFGASEAPCFVPAWANNAAQHLLGQGTASAQPPIAPAGARRGAVRAGRPQQRRRAVPGGRGGGAHVDGGG